jgi:AraC-like DNA-binding protein
MHHIRLVRPAPELEQFVRFYGQREARTHDAVVVHPVHARAAPLLEFVFGDRIKVFSANRHVATSPDIVIVGAQTQSNGELRIQGTLQCFVILFQPDGLHRLFSLPMHEFTDRSFDARGALGPLVSHLHQRLGECDSLEERVRVVDRFLLQRSMKLSGLEGISATAARIVRRAGSLPIADLATAAGLGLRQFQRRFFEQVGVQPKLFSRIVRFEAALDSKARSSTKSWAQVAHELGYFDQMHMIHDFQQFTSHVPTYTLSHMEILFRDQIHAMRSGRTDALPSDSRFIL